MPTTEIVIKNNKDQPRAIIKGLTLPQQKEMLGKVFTGEHADYYIERLRGSLIEAGARVEVIATSMEDCYSAALGRPSLLTSGESGD